MAVFSLSPAQRAQMALAVGDGTHSTTVVLLSASEGQLPGTTCLWTVTTVLQANHLVSQVGRGQLEVDTAGNVSSIYPPDVNRTAHPNRVGGLHRTERLHQRFVSWHHTGHCRRIEEEHRLICR